MFFVTILLDEVLAGCVRSRAPAACGRSSTWMKCFGYFPPSANPPAKKPMLTLLKAGPRVSAWAWSWPRRIRSISTTRDSPTPARGSSAGCKRSATRLRVIDGFEGVSAEAGRRSTARKWKRFSPGSEPRVPDEQRARRRADRDAHAVGDVVPRGPLTRDQIRDLMKDRDVTRRFNHGDVRQVYRCPARHSSPILSTTSCRSIRHSRAGQKRIAISNVGGPCGEASCTSYRHLQIDAWQDSPYSTRCMATDRPVWKPPLCSSIYVR